MKIPFTANAEVEERKSQDKEEEGRRKRERIGRTVLESVGKHCLPYMGSKYKAGFLRKNEADV